MFTKRDNYTMGTAALAEDDVNANAFEINRSFDYVIAGRSFNRAAAANLTFTAGHTALAVNQMCAFFICVNAAGAVSTIQSPIVPAANVSGYRSGAWEWPDPEDRAVIGALVVSVAAPASGFTPNTVDLGAAGVIDTFVQCSGDYGLPIAY